MLRLILLVLLLARIERLLVARSERLAGRRLVVAIVVAVVANVAALIAALLKIRLALSKLLLCRRNQTKVMFGVLIIVFRRDRIAGTLRIPGQLEIFFSDVGCGSANFYVRSIGLVHTRQWILMMMATAATFAVATAHALVLTVSHDSLFRQPPDVRRRECRLSKLTECHFNATHYSQQLQTRTSSRLYRSAAC